MGIPVGDGRRIDRSELSFVTGPSSGPGGQNVNKVETKVTLLFDVAASSSLEPDEKERLFERLRTRITKQGVLRVTSQRHRTQEANRKAALSRFAELVIEALSEAPARRPTRPSKAARRRRLEEKRRRGQLKRARRNPLE